MSKHGYRSHGRADTTGAFGPPIAANAIFRAATGIAAAPAFPRVCY